MGPFLNHLSLWPNYSKSRKGSTSHLKKCQHTHVQFKILVHFQNLEVSHSRAVNFSWTSRSQNLKLRARILRLEASHQILPTGARDIFIVVKWFPKIRNALFGQLCPRFVLEKYCCTTEKAISVSTSHVWHLFLGAKTRQGSEPPTGPP